MEKITSVDDYIASKPNWQDGLVILREILNETELEECIKWGAPIYTINGKNVAGIAAFKEHFAVWFHNGVFLSDPAKKLHNANEGVTKALRQWRFTSVDEIDPKLLRIYLEEAIQNEKKGKRLKPATPSKAKIPTELQEALNKDEKLKAQFESFTPFKQKEFAEHIGSAKQEKTRIARLEKSIPLILKGIGLNDKYRNC